MASIIMMYPPQAWPVDVARQVAADWLGIGQDMPGRRSQTSRLEDCGGAGQVMLEAPASYSQARALAGNIKKVTGPDGINQFSSTGVALARLLNDCECITDAVNQLRAFTTRILNDQVAGDRGAWLDWVDGLDWALLLKNGKSDDDVIDYLYELNDASQRTIHVKTDSKQFLDDDARIFPLKFPAVHQSILAAFSPHGLDWFRAH